MTSRGKRPLENGEIARDRGAERGEPLTYHVCYRHLAYTCITSSHQVSIKFTTSSHQVHNKLASSSQQVHNATARHNCPYSLSAQCGARVARSITIMLQAPGLHMHNTLTTNGQRINNKWTTVGQQIDNTLTTNGQRRDTS